MPKKSPSGLGLGITWLRCKSGWTKQRHAKALGMDDSALTKYERGDNSLTRSKAEWLVSPLPYPPEALDVLAVAHGLIVAEPLPEAPSPVSLTPEERGRAHRAGLAGGAAAATAISKETARRIMREKEETARQQAPKVWERLMAAAPEDRLPAVACFPELPELAPRAAGLRGERARGLAQGQGRLGSGHAGRRSRRAGPGARKLAPAARGLLLGTSRQRPPGHRRLRRCQRGVRQGLGSSGRPGPSPPPHCCRNGGCSTSKPLSAGLNGDSLKPWTCSNGPGLPANPASPPSHRSS